LPQSRSRWKKIKRKLRKLNLNAIKEGNCQ
jgi:hypothetical protein